MKKRILSLLLLVATIVTALPLVAFPAIAEEQTPPEGPIYSEDEYNSYYVLDGLFHASDLFRYNEYWRDDFTFTDRPLSPSETEAFDTVAERSGYYVLVTDVAKGTTTYYSLGSKTPWVGVAVGDRKNPYATQAEAKAAAATAQEAINAAIADYNADEANATKLDAANYTTSVSSLLLTPEYITAYNEWNTVHVGANGGVNWYNQFAWTWKDKYSTALTSWYHNTLNETSTSYANGATASLHPTSDGYATVPANLHTSSGLQITNFSATNAKFTDVTTTQVVASLGTRRDGTKFIVNNAYMSFAIDPASNGSYVSNLYYSNGGKLTKFYDADGNLLTENPLSANKVMLPVSETDVLDLTFTYTKATDVANEGPSHWNLREMNSEIFDVYAALYQSGGVYQKPATTFYFGWSGSCPDARFYAIRQYTRALSDEEIRQNHLADLMKFYRLDLGYIKLLDEEELATVALAVRDLELDDGYEVVAKAVQDAARVAAEAKNADVPAPLLAVAARYGLDLTPLRTFSYYRIPRTFTFLTEGYIACPDGATVQEGYLAALEADLNALTAGNTLSTYNAYYKQEGLAYALDFFASNEVWGLKGPATATGGTSIRDLMREEEYLWHDAHKDGKKPYASSGKSDTVQVQDGYMYIGDGVDLPLYGIADSTSYAINGVTEELVTETIRLNTSYASFYVNDTRISYNNGTAGKNPLSLIYPGDTVLLTDFSIRSNAVGPLVSKSTGLGSFTLPEAGVATTYSFSVKMPAMTQNYYQYTYPSDVVQPTATQMAGESMSTTYFYITHTVEEGEDGKIKLNENAKVTAIGVTKMQYAIFRPVYTEVTENGVTKRYITGAVDRLKTDDRQNGVAGSGMGEADSALGGATGDYWHDPAKATSSVSFAVGSKVIFAADGLKTVNNQGVCGSESRLSWSGSHWQNMYAVRYYASVLTEADMAQNHFADIAKCFKLDLAGIEKLDANGLKKLYAAVAELDVASSDRLEAQMAVSAVLEEYATADYDAPYDAYLAAGIAEHRVEVARLYGLSLDFMLSLPASFYAGTNAALDALYAAMYVAPDFAGAAKVLADGAAIDFNSDLTKNIPAERYNKLFVTNGARMLADFYGLNEYWGGAMTFPTAPPDNASYKYTDGVTYDFTKVENRLADSTSYILVRQKGDDVWSWEYYNGKKFSATGGTAETYATLDDALVAAKAQAGGDSATLLDKEKTKLDGYRSADGYDYYVVKKTIAPHAAFAQALKDYTSEVNTTLNNTRIEGGKNIGFGNNTSIISSAGHQSASGNEARVVAKPRNGYLLMKGDSAQQYFSMQSISSYQRGELQVELVMAAGDSTGGGVLFTHRDVALYATATDNGLKIEKTSTYAGTTGISFGNAGYIKDAATLSIFTDRATPASMDGKYVLARLVLTNGAPAYNNSTAARLLADGKTWSLSGDCLIFADEATALAKAKELAGDEAAVEIEETSKLDSAVKHKGYSGNGYAYFARPVESEYLENRMTVSIDGVDIVTDAIVKEWHHQVTSRIVDANNMFGYTMNALAPELYAFRYYSRQLTPEEQVRNHFADVAKYYRLDLDLYDKLDPEGVLALYEAMADVRVGGDRADAQAAYLKFFHDRGVEVTPYADILVFEGMSVRVNNEWSEPIPGVRGCFHVDEAALSRLSGKANVTFGVQILNAAGEVKATLTFTPTFAEDGITYVGENKIGDKTADAILQDGGAGIKTFAYTVIYNDYTASGGKNYQTADYYKAEYAYRSFITVDGVRYERDLIHPSFEGKISAAEVYQYFADNPKLTDKTGKPYAENSLVKDVVNACKAQ